MHRSSVQEFKLFKIYLILSACFAVAFVPLAARYIRPDFINWMYLLLSLTALYSGLLYFWIKPKSYRLGVTLLFILVILIHTHVLLIHKPEYLFISSLLVYSFIIIFSILLLPWPDILYFDITLIILVLIIMITPQTGFRWSVEQFGLEANYTITALMIYYIALLVWGTSLIEIKRRTEGKLRYMNENLNRLVDEKVTQITNLDREKREYQEQVESIFHHIPVGILVTDQAFNVLYSNDILLSFTKEHGQLIEGPDNDIPLQLIKEQILCPGYHRVVKNRDNIIGQRWEYSLNDETKRTLRYSYVAVLLTGEKEDLLRLVLITEDITNEELLRDKLAHSDHLSELGKMAANLAHEVNNPLAGIKLYLELLEQGIQDQEKRMNVFGIINTSIARIDHVIKGFLSFARQDKARKDLVDISSIIKETLEIAVGFKSLHHINIIPTCPTDLPEIMADRFKLGQVFLNLINNAKDAMADGGGILAIDVKIDQDTMIIEFKDNGKGIKQEELPHIFTPFYTTKDRGHGTGLGLSTCYGIIQDHGGSIEVVSREGLGTTFIIKLPIKHKSGIS